MSTFFLDTRELRSVRFKYYLKKLDINLNENDSIIGFFKTESFYPDEQQQWQQNNLSKNLKIFLIPSQIGRFFLKNKSSEWNVFKNLVKGQLFVLIRKNQLPLTPQDLKLFLSLKKFSLRFLISNNQLFRSNVIQTNLIRLNTKPQLSQQFIITLKTKLINLIFLTTKIKH